MLKDLFKTFIISIILKKIVCLQSSTFTHNFLFLQKKKKMKQHFLTNQKPEREKHETWVRFNPVESTHHNNHPRCLFELFGLFFRQRPHDGPCRSHSSSSVACFHPPVFILLSLQCRWAACSSSFSSGFWVSSTGPRSFFQCHSNQRYNLWFLLIKKKKQWKGFWKWKSVDCGALESLRFHG